MRNLAIGGLLTVILLVTYIQSSPDVEPSLAKPHIADKRVPSSANIALPNEGAPITLDESIESRIVQGRDKPAVDANADKLILQNIESTQEVNIGEIISEEQLEAGYTESEDNAEAMDVGGFIDPDATPETDSSEQQMVQDTGRYLPIPEEAIDVTPEDESQLEVNELTAMDIYQSDPAHNAEGMENSDNTPSIAMDVGPFLEPEEDEIL